MKRFKQHWTAGPLSWLLSAALALPALLALLALPQTARAQGLNKTPTWGVVKFTNTSGYGGAEVGVQASDGFVVELGKSNKYDILPRSQTEQGIANIGLTEPLDTIGLQRLARSLDADAVATGEVASVAFSSNPRRATVSLVVRVVDRLSGELINGAVVQGTSTPRPIPTNDDDALVNQAIQSADFNAVKQISAFNLPRATVLIHRDTDTVTLNKGTQDGLYDGLKMLVTRNGSEVGRLVVSDASPDESEATVTDRGLGIQPQDVATAIYQLPPYTNGPSGFHVGTANVAPPASDNAPRGSSRPFFTGFLGAALGIGAIVALAGAAHSGSSSNSVGGGRAGAVSAQLTSNGPTQLFIPTESAASNPSSLFIPLSIQVNFDAGDISGGHLQQFQVYRNPPPSLTTVSSVFTPTTTIAASIGQIPAFSPASSPVFDSVQDLNTIIVTKPDPSNNTGTITGTFYTGPTLAGTPPLFFTGLDVGERVTYTVQALYTVPNLTAGQTGPGGGPIGVGGGPGGVGTTTGTGTTGTGTTGTTGTTTGASGANGSFIYTLSEPVTTNAVTYLQPVLTRVNVPTGGLYPDLSGTPPQDTDIFATSTDPKNVTATLHSVFANAGDNSGSGVPLQYALEFSPDLTFPGTSNTLRYVQVGPAGGDSTNFRTGAPFRFSGINLSTKFPNPGTLYFRVGVRDQRNGSDEGSNPYLWSTVDAANSRVVPVALTPGTPNGTALRLRNGIAALAPGKAGHVRSGQSGAVMPNAIPSSTSGPRPLFVPSQTLHSADPAAAHASGPRTGISR